MKPGEPNFNVYQYVINLISPLLPTHSPLLLRLF